MTRAIARTRESAIEARFVAAVRAAGGRAVKLRQLMGWPDRLVLWPGGRAMFVELKRPVGGRLRPSQRRVHAQLTAMGFFVAVVHDTCGIDKVVAEYSNPAPTGHRKGAD